MWLEAIEDCRPMFDAAYLPRPVPEGYEAVLVYAGGSAATHAWPDEDVAATEHLHQLPAWVPDPARDDPEVAADEFLAWLTSHHFPPVVAWSGDRQLVSVDMETAGRADAAWVNRFCNRTEQHGYENTPYGSKGTLFALPPREGYYVADWTNAPHMTLAPSVLITQYQADVEVSGGQIDLDMIAAPVLRKLRRLGV